MAELGAGLGLGGELEDSQVEWEEGQDPEVLESVVG